MSCGNPHEKDCGEVLEKVYQYLDGELDTRQLAEIRRHLEECRPCLDEYELDVALKALVRRSCSERAPAQLRERILVSLTEVTVIQRG